VHFQSYGLHEVGDASISIRRSDLRSTNSSPAADPPEWRGQKQLFVDDKPFIMLSGELHNSSPSSVEYMRPIWDKLAALHLNTVD